MSTIHFIGGEKGGVGKSVMSRLLSQYFLDKSLSYVGLDADQSHATLRRFYHDYTRPIDLGVFESTDQVMEVALEEDRHVVVDLPAQSERFLDRWIEENGVLDMCEEMQMPFFYWYILDDGFDSSRLLKRFLRKYGKRITCVVVKNKGCGTNFALVDTTLAQLNGDVDGRLRQATLPALHKETMRKIDELGFSFWGAENLKEDGLPHLSLMERQRTKIWAKKAYSIFDDVFAPLEASVPA
jgi:hypothetical protein